MSNTGCRPTWQRDFFDYGHVADLYLRLLKSGKVSDAFAQRMQKGAAAGHQPGWYPLGQTPAPLWPDTVMPERRSPARP
ncbi:hypothetical protein [Nocardia cyriacigeorgica]|uniref:hypothetical protein n=1 Tax=Nocardia cyriacigeorgica TaxID=135487 RepID=UPI0018953CCB|nr:hypothetical protein [Nocardia cyriacigeorgica]MBF6415059.1 hypothetical protein [Nocardia cyriacigeorgica]